MSFHAKKSNKWLAKLLAVVLGFVASFVFLTSAQADVTYDTAGQQLNFNQAAASTSLGAIVNQVDGTDGAAFDIGADAAVGAFFHYYNIATIGGQQIDAKITITSQSGIRGSNNDLAKVELLADLDYSYDNPGENSRILTQVRYAVQTGDSYVEYKIEFLKDLTSTPSSGTAVTLQNVVVNTYDIDKYQYVEFTEVDTATLTPDTILTATPTTREDGVTVTRFVETENIDTDSDDADYMKSRVRVQFDDASQITVRLGQNVLLGTESSASYDLDFSAGESWGAVATFDSNDSSGVTSSQAAPSAASLASNSFTRSGFTFSGWNTQANGSGTSYSDGQSYPFVSSVTLYAQWSSTTPPAPAAYSGPLPVKLVPQIVDSGRTNAVVLEGDRLQGITKAVVGGLEAEITTTSNEEVFLVLPSLEAGTYNVVYTSAQGNVTHQNSLIVRQSTKPAVSGAAETAEPEVSDAAETAKPFYVAKRFSNYLGDVGSVTGADEAAITKFISDNPGLTTVTCLGSTSGVPALTTDAALAKARAENACGVVERLVPGVTTKTVTTVGLGIGQFYRAVTVFGTGVATR